MASTSGCPRQRGPSSCSGLRSPLVSETFARAGVFLKDDVTVDGVFGGNQVQMEEENQRGGELLHLQQHGAENFRPVGSLGSLSGSQVSLSSSLWSRPTSALSTNSRSSRSGPAPSRAFVPHSPLDLQIGHRVRIMLPSGRISTGRLRYVGPLEDSRDFRLGVELETPHHGQNDGALEGQSYFKWYTRSSASAMPTHIRLPYACPSSIPHPAPPHPAPPSVFQAHTCSLIPPRTGSWCVCDVRQAPHGVGVAPAASHRQEVQRHHRSPRPHKSGGGAWDPKLPLIG
ncbi:hypothetical protein JZ751_019531 [Albula glossodonta]|uniref:CAP-Gly domain-containing protein n=1 Tax=Albula glossodonta TaxID=121402 RepID=A0A8T2MSF0_9TELE|nr:hypothetical protein JZ751_019531 [Albula glossodonta]